MPQETSPRANEIIAIATKLFACRGYDGVSVRDICSELSVNFSIISYYFGGKTGLYQEVLRRQFEACAKVFTEVAAQKLNPPEELAALCEAFCVWHGQNPYFSRLVARESGGPGPEFQQLARDYEEGLGGRLLELIRGGQRQGLFKSALRPEAAVLAVSLLLNGPAALRILEPEPADWMAAHYFDTIKDIIFGGILAEPAGGDAEGGRTFGRNTPTLKRNFQR